MDDILQELVIDKDFITLGQALKLTDTISSGGMAKFFLFENDVFVNGEKEDRRGRKLRDGDSVTIPGVGRVKIVQSTDT